MARQFPGGAAGANDDRVVTSLTSYPNDDLYSFAVWFNRTSGTGDTLARRFFDKDAGAVQLWMSDAAANHPSHPGDDQIVFQRAFSTTAGQWKWFFDQGEWEGGWHHLALTHDGSSPTNEAVLYLDGTDQGPKDENDGGSVDPAGTIETSGTGGYHIGNRDDFARCWDGKLAHFAVWHGVTLTASEVAALAAGVSPLRIRPDRLVCYVPLYGVDPEPDLAPSPAGTATVTGTTVPADSAPVGRTVSAPRWDGPLAAAGDISGTASIAEASDTVAAAGSVEISGTAALAEASDQVAASGSVEISGTATLTEAGDTVAASGSVEISGTAAVTEASDTVAGSGTVEISGIAAITEASDSVNADGTLGVSGSAAITEQSDTAAASGTVEISGAISFQELSDILAAVGGVELAGSASITERPDTVTASGSTAADRTDIAAMALGAPLTHVEAGDVLTHIAVGAPLTHVEVGGIV